MHNEHVNTDNSAHALLPLWEDWCYRVRVEVNHAVCIKIWESRDQQRNEWYMHGVVNRARMLILPSRHLYMSSSKKREYFVSARVVGMGCTASRV